jgi:endonuclease/exonuclease/phosphatase family metal-dependent hydrolase
LKPTNDLKIVSWNLLHRAGATLGEVERLIEWERPDLMLMQEATDAIDLLPAKIGGYYARSPLPGRRHGLAAWSPAPFTRQPAAVTLQPGMIVRRVCQIIGIGAIGIANVHLSHGQVLNRRQLWRIALALPSMAAILGDCNLVGPPLLRGFRDVGPRSPTHNAGTLVPLRLDRCFVRGLDCRGAAILSRGASDHLPISVRLAVPAP